jgi:hypothetical protein
MTTLESVCQMPVGLPSGLARQLGRAASAVVSSGLSAVRAPALPLTVRVAMRLTAVPTPAPEPRWLVDETARLEGLEQRLGLRAG